MKWVVGGFSHETNTFSTIPTDMEAFRSGSYGVGDEIRVNFAGTRTAIGGFLEVIDRRGDEAVMTVAASATPSGKVTSDAFETIASLIGDGVKAHPDADGILLSLHGAMVAETHDDGEGEILNRVRAAAGDDKPIVVVLDLHSHITETMVGKATAIIGFQKYPHTDPVDRGAEAAELIARLAEGSVNPVAALEKPPIIPPCGTCNTEFGLYKELWADALRSDRPDKILASSLFAGFPYADIPHMGYAVLVYADGDEAMAKAEAKRLADAAWEGREAFRYTPTSVEEAVRRAKGMVDKPVVINDMADNPGGGGSNDSVSVLRELIAQDVSRAAVGTIYDPVVVEEAELAGVGNTINTLLGAKSDDMHGEPVEIDGRVRLIYDGRFIYKGPMSRGAQGNIGKAAVIDVGGIQVIVCSHRAQTLDPEVFRSAGIDPMEQDILAVKSAVHFRAGFSQVAKKIIMADGPGLTSLDLAIFPWTNIRRPLWPIDD